MSNHTVLNNIIMLDIKRHQQQTHLNSFLQTNTTWKIISCYINSFSNLKYHSIEETVRSNWTHQQPPRVLISFHWSDAKPDICHSNSLRWTSGTTEDFGFLLHVSLQKGHETFATYFKYLHEWKSFFHQIIVFCCCLGTNLSWTGPMIFKLSNTFITTYTNFFAF